MRKILTVLLAAYLLLTNMALAEMPQAEPAIAWTVCKANVYQRPQMEDTLIIAEMAKDCRICWLDTQEEWAYIDIQGERGYVPVEVLTTDRVFDLRSMPANNAAWPYEGEIRISPDGVINITIWLSKEDADGLIFAGAELSCFEIIDDLTGELVCTAEPNLSGDPVKYSGEGIYTQGRALLVRPVLRHDGYAVEIQW